MKPSSVSFRALVVGLAFLLPNILGFLTFTLAPLFVSLAMAFTNWDLRLHNMFNGGEIKFVGLANFQRLLTLPDFWQYFGNTLFLMLGIPFSIAASLLTALLLSHQPKSPRRQAIPIILAGTGLSAGCGLLVAAGTAGSAFSLLIAGLFTLMFLGGASVGTGFYRTIYYLPNFTAGVATFLLWKKMYDPQTGPVNAAIQPALDRISALVTSAPSHSGTTLSWLMAGMSAVILFVGMRLVAARHAFDRTDYRPHRHQAAKRSVWRAGFVLAIAAGVFLLSRETPGFFAAAGGLKTPNWLTDYHWAKPALMIMGFWASIGSNNMLLYLAALGNVPKELQEAASIDGAGPLQRFVSITWPQLAPVTFFIIIMSVISGLQGGFEMARTMTQGGPGGATTTLSYFVFSEGFTTGRLGYASAIAWTLFAFVFAVTLLNWKFGNRAANE